VYSQYNLNHSVWIQNANLKSQINHMGINLARIQSGKDNGIANVLSRVR
jgi:hypothetical protein